MVDTGRLIELLWNRALQFLTEAERIAEEREFSLACECNGAAFLRD